MDRIVQQAFAERNEQSEIVEEHVVRDDWVDRGSESGGETSMEVAAAAETVEVVVGNAGCCCY